MFYCICLPCIHPRGNLRGTAPIGSTTPSPLHSCHHHSLPSNCKLRVGVGELKLESGMFTLFLIIRTRLCPHHPLTHQLQSFSQCGTIANHAFPSSCPSGSLLVASCSRIHCHIDLANHPCRRFSRISVTIKRSPS